MLYDCLIDTVRIIANAIGSAVDRHRERKERRAKGLPKHKAVHFQDQLYGLGSNDHIGSGRIRTGMHGQELSPSDQLRLWDEQCDPNSSHNWNGVIWRGFNMDGFPETIREVQRVPFKAPYMPRDPKRRRKPIPTHASVRSGVGTKTPTFAERSQPVA